MIRVGHGSARHAIGGEGLAETNGPRTQPADDRRLLGNSAPVGLLAARHIAIDTHVARYFCCVDWEPHLRVVFDARLHVADAVHQELRPVPRRAQDQ